MRDCFDATAQPSAGGQLLRHLVPHFVAEYGPQFVRDLWSHERLQFAQFLPAGQTVAEVEAFVQAHGLAWVAVAAPAAAASLAAAATADTSAAAAAAAGGAAAAAGTTQAAQAAANAAAAPAAAAVVPATPVARQPTMAKVQERIKEMLLAESRIDAIYDYIAVCVCLRNGPVFQIIDHCIDSV